MRLLSLASATCVVALAATGGAQERSPDRAEPGATGEAAAGSGAPNHEDATGSKEPNDEPSPQKPPPPDGPPLAPGEKREVPDYDNRDDPTTAGDVLIWVPRVLLSPLYFVSEFVVRRPLGLLVTTAEKNDWPAILIDFFTFGPEREAGIIPTFLIDFGFRTSAGVYFYWDDVVAEDNHLRARVAYGGPGWLRFGLRDRYEFSEFEDVTVSASYMRRPDYSFWGLGPRADGDEARFHIRQVDFRADYELWPWHRSVFRSSIGYRTASYDGDSTALGDESLDEAIARGRLEAPPGLDTGFRIGYQGLTVALDTRPLREVTPSQLASDYEPEAGSGIRAEVHGEHAVSLRRVDPAEPGGTPRHHWIRYGGIAGGYWDITGEQRVLGLWVAAEFVDPLVRGGEIPFTELVSLGGFRPMRGFRMNRLLDRSAVVANLEYHWPIWVFLDGAMDFTLGNVFGEHLNDFAFDLLRGSFDIGIRGVGARDHLFEVLFGLGTEPIDEGFGVDSFRFVFGSTTSF